LTVAVFVMEIGIESRIPTYSGGLGILAGDLVNSFADLGIGATFVTLLSRNGYALQKLSPSEGQNDSPQPWDWRSILTKTASVAKVEIGERTQTVGAWEYKVGGKAEASILFLDTDYPENDAEVREATDRLYGGAQATRLVQDIVLGVGGYRMLKALGRDVQVYHLNESHAAFATVELLRERGAEGAKRSCVFTTHTPIAAGNDTFPVASVREAFRSYSWVNWDAESVDGVVSLAKVAARHSGVTNAVSLKHKFVSNGVVGLDRIVYVTNGVYHRRWVHPELKKLYDRYIPGWAESPSLLGRAYAIPSEDLRGAHAEAKRALVSFVKERGGVGFEEDALVITVAKRFTSYKRNGMVLGDTDSLGRIASKSGKIQIIVAGKAHPRDDVAKGMLAEAIQKASRVNESVGNVRVAVLENYDIDMAKVLVAGSDVWLNNPRRPLEACGTSGMKAAMNGVLNLSVYDGWWLEGGVEGVNGWGIGRRTEWTDLAGPAEGEDEKDLYTKLAESVVPTYYGQREKWTEMSKSSIATVGPQFNSYRMAEDYLTRVYAHALGFA
jgi:glycogen phosphorylase